MTVQLNDIYSVDSSAYQAIKVLREGLELYIILREAGDRWVIVHQFWSEEACLRNLTKIINR